ncbi:olfactory receptor 1F1-like isoform X1 [Anguilla anguilla]|uniref:olfactory receptor 1F1-like isoform X1 n=1 Tax=Anguilla anguilla TaxID=7936 RepID=UPI0015A7E07F|nr:olfactory receptor 1F1-like isoform X1 [Anguilla anguilla]XP_035288009.1 olfactory receptor 1F1-like isoform X1 [Anguilla anguilla]
MRSLNSTSFLNTTIVRPEFFFIRGLAGIPHTKYYYFFLCFVYAVTLLANTFVMLMIYTDHCLHSPKYIAVFNLAVSDLCGSTTLIPQLIDTFLFKSQLIAFEACLTNLYFIYVFYAMQSLTLTILSYDRGVAICFPLRYNEIVTNKSMLLIVSISWMFPSVATLISTIILSRLSFCKSIVVNSFFCDYGPIYNLACNDNTPSNVIRWTYPVVFLWFPLLFIIGTYISIARALLKIAAASERLKAMKTCSAHLILESTENHVPSSDIRERQTTAVHKICCRTEAEFCGQAGMSRKGARHVQSVPLEGCSSWTPMHLLWDLSGAAVICSEFSILYLYNPLHV